MTRVNHPLVHPPGIFFGLPDEEYHRAFALSASGVRTLLADPHIFWALSPLNPTPEEETAEESYAKTFGRATHCRVLEPTEFPKRFVAKLDIADFPGALRTSDDIKERLRGYGGRLSGKKADLIEGLLYHEPAAVIWDLRVEEHAAKHAGKTFMSYKDIRKIEIAAAMIEKHPELGKAFRGGHPEVSVFWFEEVVLPDGEIIEIPCKVRFDYLKPRAVFDLKTVEAHAVPLKKAFGRSVVSYKLHVQACLYLQASYILKKLISDGLVYGPAKDDKAFLEAVAANEEFTFCWIVQRKGIAPTAQGFTFPPSIVLDRAAARIEEARQRFADCWRRFGTDPWIIANPIEALDTSDFPVWIMDD